LGPFRTNIGGELFAGMDATRGTGWSGPVGTGWVRVLRKLGFV